MTPRISVQFSDAYDCYQLVATSYSVTSPAGPRLFRGGDFPEIEFLHVDESEALKDAAKLQVYIDLAWAGKAPRAKGREEAEQPKLTVWDLKNAVWMV